MTVSYLISVTITILIFYIWRKHFTPAINRLVIIAILALQLVFLLFPKGIAEVSSMMLTCITIITFFINYMLETIVCNHKSKIFSKIFLWLVEPAKIAYLIQLDKIQIDSNDGFISSVIRFINESNLDKDLKKETIKLISQYPPYKQDMILIIETGRDYKQACHRYIPVDYNISNAYEGYNVINLTK